MAMSKIAAQISLDASGMRAGANQAASAISRLRGDIGGLQSSLTGLTALTGAQVLGSVFSTISSAATSAISSIVRMSSAAADTVDNMSKFAQRIGVSYGVMSGFAYAADLAGVSTESLVGAMTKANILFEKASAGSTTAQAAFAGIGLSMEQLASMNADQRFYAIAEAISQLPTASQQAAAAVAIFGKAGASLLPLFQQGAGGIREAVAEAERLGLVLTTAQGRNVEAMNDSWTKVRRSIDGIIQQVVANLSPAIEALNTMWTDFVQQTGGQNIGEYIADALFRAGEYFAGVADYFYANLRSIWEYAQSVAGSWFAAFDFGRRIVAAIEMIVAGLKVVMGSLILAFTGAIELAVRAVQGAIAAIPGFDGSSLNSTVAALKGFNDSLVTSIENAGSNVASSFFEMIGEGGADAGEAIAGPFSDAIRAARQSMLDARAAVETPEQPAAGAAAPLAQQLEVAAGKIASAVDARSKEGVKEMITAMYGGRSTVDEQQLEAQKQANGLLEDIRDGLDEDEPMEAMAF